MKAFIEWLKSLFTKPVKVEPLPKVNISKPTLEADLREELVSLIRSDLKLRETHGKNRSPVIDEINQTVKGAYLGAPYCISGLVSRGLMRLCRERNYKMPSWMNTASTQAFYDNAPEKYKKPKGAMPKKGDIAIQQSRSDAGKGHAYLITADQTAITHKTIEYNTDGSGGRDGDGVYERIRTQDGDASKKYRGAVDVIQAIIDFNKKG